MSKKAKDGTKRAKAVKVALLKRKHSGKVTQPYQIMEDLIDKHHPKLGPAKIAIAWQWGWKEDADGRLILGKMAKASDLDKEFHEHDFVLKLNHEAWNGSTLYEAQRRAVIDHELCHAMPSIDDGGEQKKDDRDRLLWRIRKHDIEEFQEIVARHGCYITHIESFVAAAVEKGSRPLLSKAEEADTADGPRRIKLVRDVGKFANPQHGLFRHTEFNTAASSNGAVVIESQAGERVQLEPDDFVVVDG